MIEVLQAYQAGKKIECGYDDGKTWLEIDQPAWDFENRQYRIAPEPKKKVKLVAFIDSHGELRWFLNGVLIDKEWIRVPSEDKEIEI